jgi:HSP20 family protein
MVAHLLTFGPIWDQDEVFTNSSLWNRLQQLQNDRAKADARQGPVIAASDPAVNIWEDAESVYVEAELPGLEHEEVELYVTGDNQFTIKGERKEKLPEKGVALRQERRLGRFSRVVTLPVNVNQDKVEACLENGVLRVKMSKQEATKPRQILVKGQ